jgi:hypothetical protein
VIQAARWIGCDDDQNGVLPILRRVFTLDKRIDRATVDLCGLGQHELCVNGTKVGNDVMEPPWTNYAKTCLYVTHDLTPLLKTGENVIDVLLGNGMYNVPSSKRYKKFKGTFGPPKLILELRLAFADGSSRTIVSDESWQYAPSPISFTCIYGGEDYDARIQPTGWKSAKRVDGPGGVLKPASSPPIRVMNTFAPVKVSEPKPGVRIFDLGQNFSGWPKITARGRAGSTIKLITAELLDQDGFASQKNSGSPVYFSYKLSGDGEETWHPRFSYTGFRFLQAEGDIDALAGVEGQFIHSSAKVVGQFECSSELFNRIHTLILNAIKSNFQHVLTDCPHREKLGWLEQTHLMGPAVLFNFDAASFYAKICADMRDAQLPNGCVPTIAPQYTTFQPPWDIFNDSPEWGSAMVINPWLIYQRTGDRAILEENYEAMKRYVEYLHTREQEGIIDYGLGDWYDIGPGEPGFAKLTSKAVTATGIYLYDVVVLGAAAKLLGHKDDANRYLEFSHRIRNALHRKFFDPATERYDTGSQTAQAMALFAVVPPHEHWSAVLDHLIADIRAHDNHITAGDIGFHFVIRALADNNRSDVIFDLLSRTDPPSYGAQLASGATTLTEAWDANPKVSQNHLMLGHAEFWFYEYLAGIRIDLSRASNQVGIRPAIVGDLTHVQASYESPRGRIASEWRCSGKRVNLKVTIPPNVTAHVEIPATTLTPRAVTAGEHEFDAVLGD